MTELHRLQPHDPVPESGRYILVLRRFAEDAPQVTLVELVISDGRDPPQLTVPVKADGTPMNFEDAVTAARAMAEREDFAAVYAADRTAGTREQEVLAHHGDHAVGMEKLDDMDLEEGERGSDLRDRA
jgi:hypothetical protein